MLTSFCTARCSAARSALLPASTINTDPVVCCRSSRTHCSARLNVFYSKGKKELHKINLNLSTELMCTVKQVQTFTMGISRILLDKKVNAKLISLSRHNLKLRVRK